MTFEVGDLAIIVNGTYFFDKGSEVEIERVIYDPYLDDVPNYVVKSKWYASKLFVKTEDLKEITNDELKTKLRNAELKIQRLESDISNLKKGRVR